MKKLILLSASLLIHSVTTFTMFRYTSKLPQYFQGYLAQIFQQTAQQPSSIKPEINIDLTHLKKFIQRQASSASFSQNRLPQDFQEFQQQSISNHELMNLQKINAFMKNTDPSYCSQIFQHYENSIYENTKNVPFIKKSPEPVQDFFYKEPTKHDPLFIQDCKNNKELAKLYYYGKYTTVNLILAIYTLCHNQKYVMIDLIFKTYIFLCLIIFIVYSYLIIYKMNDPELHQIIDDPEILEVIQLLQDAFGLQNISFYKISENKEDPTNIAHYRDSTKSIYLQPKFFKYSKNDQVNILFHEIRHAIQFQRKAELSSDMIEYAKVCNLDLGWAPYRIFKLASYWSSPLREFDAEYFAYKNIPVKGNRFFSKFDPNQGYFALPQINHVIKSEKINELWVQFINDPNVKRSCLAYIPHELKQLATENAYSHLKQQRKQDFLKDLLEKYSI